ncbi:cuticular protein 57A [Haematobia irritans]|uniref:cuticular protein 57A n=1 Tax=Haematobia irritans TaxID=7368 RepID=UPI003F4FA9BB
MKLFIFMSMSLAVALADVSHVVNHHTTPQPTGPANPYVFSYQAGRAPGHVDRQHTEVSDGTGVIRGAFSYVDPKNQVRTVQYVADEHGFHPQLSHQLEDSEAVKAAKQKHFQLYNRIAQEHATGVHHPEVPLTGPNQSEAVVRATNKHLSAFERIAAEHAAIGAQQEAERLQLAAQGHGDEEDGQYHPERY